MATRKDLVEAHSFNRRRLVTAFVSGAPGGREVDPVRPGRTVAAGLAVSVLVLAGAAVYAALGSPSTVDWDSEALVSDRETGADYLLLRTDDPDDGSRTELRPLANITSAMLVLGHDVTTSEASHDDVVGHRRGAPVGIVGAPATPPDAGDLVQDGWTACSGDATSVGATGLRVTLVDDPDVDAAPDAAFLVSTGADDLFLLVQSESAAGEEAVALPVPADATDRLLDAVAGTRRTAAVPVPAELVALFPTGAALDAEAFGIDPADLGDRWALRRELDDPAARASAEVGDLLEVDGRSYLLTVDGIRPLTAFERAVWQDVEVDGAGAADGVGVLDGVSTVPDVAFSTGVEATSWPGDVLPGGGQGEPCALLDTSGPTPRTLLATAGAGASGAGVAVGEVERTVATGGGAFVSSDDGPVLVDERGTAYPVGTGGEQEALGYARVAEVVVPGAWIDVLGEGVSLTSEAARE
jgi:hypothetical protein